MDTLYEKQGFEDGQILYAENLIKMEDGIKAVEDEITRLDEQMADFEERFDFNLKEINSHEIEEMFGFKSAGEDS